MPKPKFFISSTIHDLKHLRSALKWWLQEYGFSVNASEYNDFEKPLDENSYKACLEAIKACDYFVLIISERSGGNYDDTATITQMEYRFAYELMKKGKIKVINFALSEIWNSHAELRKKINKIPETRQTKKQKEQFKIFRFIDEVRRVAEMKTGKNPIGNWIHVINSFEDIVSVLETNVIKHDSLFEKKVWHQIKSELIQNLRTLGSNHKGALYPIAFLSHKLFGSFVLDLNMNKIQLTKDQINNFGIFYLSSTNVSKTSIRRLESAFKDGYFLEYSFENDDYVSGDSNQIAEALLFSLNKIKEASNTLHSNSTEKFLEIKREKDKGSNLVSQIDVFLGLELYDDILYSMDLIKNLILLKEKKDYIIPVRPISNRIPDEVRPGSEDKLTDEIINKYLYE